MYVLIGESEKYKEMCVLCIKTWNYKIDLDKLEININLNNIEGKLYWMNFSGFLKLKYIDENIGFLAKFENNTGEKENTKQWNEFLEKMSNIACIIVKIEMDENTKEFGITGYDTDKIIKDKIKFWNAFE